MATGSARNRLVQYSLITAQLASKVIEIDHDHIQRVDDGLFIVAELGPRASATASAQT